MSYGEENIKTLSTMEGIRTRPAMYIDEIGKRGCFKLDMELIQNAIDEYNAGRCSEVIIKYDQVSGEFSVTDNGCGIPIGKIVEACTNLHSGGKFDNAAYKFHSGQNGVGLTVVNALSSKMVVEVYREGNCSPNYAKIEFSKGDLISETYDTIDSQGRHGTTVSFIADVEIMKETDRDRTRYDEFFEMSMYVNKGLAIDFIFGKHHQRFYSEEGLPGYIQSFSKKKKVRQVIEPQFISASVPEMNIDIAFLYGTENSGDSTLLSFVNGNRTPENGSHVTGLKSGLGLALTNYIQQNQNLVPKLLKNVKLSGPMISDNISAIVILHHIDPMFNGQTKQKLNMPDVETYVKKVAYDYFSTWLKKNTVMANKLVGMIIDFAKYEIERNKLKKEIMNPPTVKSMFDKNGINPAKFHDCRSNNASECEIFITEGESAGGTVASARDDRFQAYYNLRGKVPNVIRGKDFNEELKDLTMIIGTGMGDKKNPSKLKYTKFVILTDADDDGGHIATLLIGFFYKYFPELIENGMVYQAKPPIKQLISKSHSIYIQNDEEYNFYIREAAVRLFKLKAVTNDKELSEDFFRCYIRNLDGYKDLIDNLVQSLSLNPETLELICLNYDDLINDRFDAFTSRGYHVTRSVTNPSEFGFDKGISHETVSLNLEFFNNVYTPVVTKLSTSAVLTKNNDIGVYLESIESGNQYYGSNYFLAKVFENIMGNNVTVKRFKGLGEMNPDQLKETAIDPETRKIVKINMGDAEKAARAIDIYLGTGEDRKTAFMSGVF